MIVWPVQTYKEGKIITVHVVCMSSTIQQMRKQTTNVNYDHLSPPVSSSFPLEHNYPLLLQYNLTLF